MWGCNPDCRLMVEDSENQNKPTLTILEQVKLNALKNHELAEAYEPYCVSLGVTHSAVITRNGNLYTGGSKVDGQLGVKFSKHYSSSA
jgi:alpha-tubulin suppressor-like RCC1 family protein